MNLFPLIVLAIATTNCLWLLVGAAFDPTHVLPCDDETGGRVHLFGPTLIWPRVATSLVILTALFWI